MGKSRAKAKAEPTVTVKTVTPEGGPPSAEAMSKEKQTARERAVTIALRSDVKEIENALEGPVKRRKTMAKVGR